MSDPYVIDVEKEFATLITDNWDDQDGEVPCPEIYYSESLNVTHDYYYGSAVWLASGPQMHNIFSIDYNSIGKETTLYCKLESLDRELFYKQCDEFIKTILRIRKDVDGWDVVLPRNVNPQKYISFYSCNMDIHIRRISQPIGMEGTL